jgi:hypothetical protein
MARDPKLVAADEGLTAAIETARLAYFPEDERAMMGSYVVVYNEQVMDGEGEVQNSYGTLMRNGSMASTEVVGLLETAAFDVKMGPHRG